MSENISKDENITSSEVVLVNVVKVFPGKQQAAIEVLRETVKYVAQKYESFQWSRLYASIDGDAVINQALWKDKSQFESLFVDPEFLERYEKLRETGTWEYRLYEITDLILPARHAEGMTLDER